MYNQTVTEVHCKVNTPLRS